MNGGIYLIQDGGGLVEMKQQDYDSEGLLQELLAKYPNLLAGDQIDNSAPRRWLLISREAGLPGEERGGNRWSVDHLFLDQDAIPTIVEVKRSSDTRIRREIVGQMLDYAANAVVYWPIEGVRAKFEENCRSEGRDSEEVLSGFLGPETEAETFWQRAKTNLQAGRVRLVFVADEIPAELRRVIEFLNEQMDPAEVLGVEIKQFVGKRLKTLVPRVMGQTAEAQQKKSASGQERRQWDESSFFAELESKSSASEVAVARRVLDWARPKVTRIWWGQGNRSGSFVPILSHKDKDHQLFAVWTYATFEIYFYWYQYKSPFDSEEKRRELLGRLNLIKGISIPDDAITKRPNIHLSVLQDESVLKQFLSAFDWVIQQIKAS